MVVRLFDLVSNYRAIGTERLRLTMNNPRVRSPQTNWSSVPRAMSLLIHASLCIFDAFFPVVGG
jgi:hypothetical protein